MKGPAGVSSRRVAKARMLLAGKGTAIYKDVSIVLTFQGIQQCFLQRVVLEKLHTRPRIEKPLHAWMGGKSNNSH